MTRGEICFLVIFPTFTLMLFLLPWLVRKVAISLDKCNHDWRFSCELPYSVIYGYGELKCNKCQKIRTSWSPMELLAYKHQIIKK